jgi:hypothetical protein
LSPHVLAEAVRRFRRPPPRALAWGDWDWDRIGARVASFFWIQSHVPDEAARPLLYDLDQAIQGLSRAHAPDDARLLKLTGVYHNLLRRWAQT